MTLFTPVLAAIGTSDHASAMRTAITLALLVVMPVVAFLLVAQTNMETGLASGSLILSAVAILVIRMSGWRYPVQIIIAVLYTAASPVIFGIIIMAGMILFA